MAKRNLDGLRDLYRAKYKNRHWLYELDCFLDQAELEFADAVTLGFLSNALGEIIEAGFQPGTRTS